MQFLGLAEALFSDDLARLVDKRREIVRAENRKDFFFQLVQQIAPGLFADQDLQVGLTEASIQTAKARLDQEIGRLVEARTAEFERVRLQIDRSKSNLQVLLTGRSEALARRTELQAAIYGLERRLVELQEYRQTLTQEGLRW